MSPDIVLIRDRQGYRILHGYLHLANALTMSDAVYVDVKGEGVVKIVKTPDGYFVSKDGQALPIIRK